jgi:hypothetical protein
MNPTNWIWKQLNARDAVDAMAVVVSAAVQDLGTKRVAEELRKLAGYLERTGSARH